MTNDQKKAITSILTVVSRTLRRGVTVNQIITAIPQGSGQNRPCGVASKPAIWMAQDVILSIPLSPRRATLFWFSSFVDRI
jgi:hypothetical protein